METCRHWSVSLRRDSDDVPHCQILSYDKAEWRLIPSALCRWSCRFLADQLWFMTCIRDEELKVVTRTKLAIDNREISRQYMPLLYVLCSRDCTLISPHDAVLNALCDALVFRWQYVRHCWHVNADRLKPCYSCRRQLILRLLGVTIRCRLNISFQTTLKMYRFQKLKQYYRHYNNIKKSFIPDADLLAFSDRKDFSLKTLTHSVTVLQPVCWQVTVASCLLVSVINYCIGCSLYNMPVLSLSQKHGHPSIWWSDMMPHELHWLAVQQRITFKTAVST